MAGFRQPSRVMLREKITPREEAARHGRKGRHFVVFRSSAPYQIEVLRLLHDSMDLACHRA